VEQQVDCAGDKIDGEESQERRWRIGLIVAVMEVMLKKRNNAQSKEGQPM
jgi:hypothetical protein